MSDVVADKILVSRDQREAQRCKSALALGPDWRAVGMHQSLAGFRANRIVLIGVSLDRQIDVDWVEQVLRLRLMPGGKMETL
ncbi:hypothetical protein [Mesorhizobium sp. M8A.F.Ca.ET.021.01.1.1]|uniref:hypothetical protein n=1 Tax=Mesorhizobium sp. M8A.F.Ca.ET.021.01.1.1 TaxID=2496757 RepID=UPI000FCB94EF|nr:hypothetical protein [Mesorhizobium sp. M8A.F.Ca.ET.021.01.1.1]RUW56815.1 hypothetical protein EOA36_02120 [Mesorhizobium sp. M8A.F.Ca.ET.021.01.1.1]